MDSYNWKLYEHGFKQLNRFQQSVVEECYDKKVSGISVKIGQGKTIISLVLSLYMTQNNKLPILVVCSKSLITNWENEIKKFFGEKLKYRVIHPTMYDMEEWTIKYPLYLTTPDVLTKIYNKYKINNIFIYQERAINGRLVNNYNHPIKPYLKHKQGEALFYSTLWGSLIVDEAQLYTNIKTVRCQAIGAIASKRRWLLSGTLFEEPKACNILGYHILLNAPDKPRNLPDTKKLIKGNSFKGLNEHLVIRNDNVVIPSKVVDKVLTHQLNKVEEQLYLLFKDILVAIQAKIKKAKQLSNKEEYKKYRGYVLAMITYLRLSLICPTIALKTIMNTKSDLSLFIKTHIKKLNIECDEQSSRIQEINNCVNKHNAERIIIFSCYSSFLNILNNHLPKRDIFVLSSKMTIEQRGDCIKQFEASQNGILLLTYDLGATGLNLQCASVVLLADQYWHCNRARQAIGRIWRQGQIASAIYLYFFTANTGIEKIIYEKQQAKQFIINELCVGKQITKIPKLKLQDVIHMINIHDNKKILEDIYF
jgi:SNF2 family DNA or RNA helicase